MKTLIPLFLLCLTACSSGKPTTASGPKGTTEEPAYQLDDTHAVLLTSVQTMDGLPQLAYGHKTKAEDAKYVVVGTSSAMDALIVHFKLTTDTALPPDNGVGALPSCDRKVAVRYCDHVFHDHYQGSNNLGYLPIGTLYHDGDFVFVNNDGVAWTGDNAMKAMAIHWNKLAIPDRARRAKFDELVIPVRVEMQRRMEEATDAFFKWDSDTAKARGYGAK